MREAGLLKRLVDSIKDLVTDVNLVVTPKGISIQAMDNSHVALVSLELEASGFMQFKCQAPSMELGISVGAFAKVLKLAEMTDEVEMKSGNTNLMLKFKNTKTQKDTEFEMTLVHAEEEQLSVPSNDCESFIQLPSAEFSRTCTQFHAMSETLTIQTLNTGILKLAVDGGDLGSGEIKFTPSKKDSSTHHIDVREPVLQRFSLKFLSMFNKASSLSPYVRLELTSEQPIAVMFALDEPDCGKGLLRFFLAPKIIE